MASITAALDALDAAVEILGAADIEELPAPQRFAAIERLETAVRRQVAISHEQITHLERCEGCPPIPLVVADVLRISRSAAKRRMRDAEQITPRTTLTGESLPPLLPETGKAWAAGLLDGEHVRVLQKFFRDLPDHVGPVEIETAERTLAEHAPTMRPDQLEKIADRLAVHLNPDGQYSEEDRARKRGFAWCGAQRPDGMSVGKLVADPQLRAEVDALFAKLAAPEPDDLRSHAQRQHDALQKVVHDRLGDPKLGQHNGLPVTMIVTTTLQHLQAGAGHAVTAGGTLIPITDLIRMNAPANNYLAVFDDVTGQSLWLGRSKRLASADQRISESCCWPNTAAAPHRDAPSTATTAKSTTPPKTGNTAAPPTSTTSPSPANATTCSSKTKAGRPINYPTAKPNGHPRPTCHSSAAPTRTTIPNAPAER